MTPGGPAEAPACSPATSITAIDGKRDRLVPTQVSSIVNQHKARRHDRRPRRPRRRPRYVPRRSSGHEAEAARRELRGPARPAGARAPSRCWRSPTCSQQRTPARAAAGVRRTARSRRRSRPRGRAGAGTSRCWRSRSRCALILVAAARAADAPWRSRSSTPRSCSLTDCQRLDGGDRTCSPTAWSPRGAPRRTFLDSVPEQVNVGVMAFNQTPTILQSPTTDRDAVKAALAQLTPSGGTATGDAIATAVTHAHARRPARPASSRRPRRSCCSPTAASTSGVATPIAAAQQAGRRHIPIYTVALGTAGGDDHGQAPARRRPRPVRSRPTRDAARRSRAASGGKAYTAADAERPRARSTSSLGSQLGTRTSKRQITLAFAGGGARAAACRRRAVAALVRAPHLSNERRTDDTDDDPHRRPRARRARRAPRSRRRCTRSSASSSARTRCSSGCSSRCSPAATCCSRACPAWPRR